MTETIKPDVILNCKGVHCPYNYVKTKLALEEMDLHSVLEVIVDEGEPSRHVPKSVTSDGQSILTTFKDEEGLIHIVIQKIKEY